MENKIVKNKFLFNYVWDIYDVSKANGVDLGIGRDMFCTNLNNYGIEGAEFYEGAKTDYATVSKDWANVDKAGAKVGCKELMVSKYDELCEAYTNKDREAFDAVVNAYEFKD